MNLLRCIIKSYFITNERGLYYSFNIILLLFLSKRRRSSSLLLSHPDAAMVAAASFATASAIATMATAASIAASAKFPVAASAASATLLPLWLRTAPSVARYSSAASPIAVVAAASATAPAATDSYLRRPSLRRSGGFAFLSTDRRKKIVE